MGKATTTELVGASAAIARTRAEARAAAGIDSPVLITGETGVGKGLVARLIHRQSPRRHRPWVHFNCAALVPGLVESELFGHERGAFTGAVARREGRFELARDGTIFLDEVGELDGSVQGKLLRLLEDREFERVGGGETHRVSARVVAATNVDLPRAVEDGAFRADLFFRLGVFRIHVPALRERRDDIPLLARAGLRRIASRLGGDVPRLPASFFARATRHTWPGNVRQLFNALERLCVRHRCGADLSEVVSEIFEEESVWHALSANGSGRVATAGPAGGLSAVSRHEREVVAAALVSSGGNVAQAARRLMIPRSTLRYKIQRYDLAALTARS